jgi:hypothetical protein
MRIRILGFSRFSGLGDLMAAKGVRILLFISYLILKIPKSSNPDASAGDAKMVITSDAHQHPNPENPQILKILILRLGMWGTLKMPA